MEVRSYRRVFELERRVYRVEGLRLNPGGVPVRGIVYFAVALAVAATVAHIPLTGTLVRRVPWLLWDLALPAGTAAVLCGVRVEGRAFHVFAGAILRYWLAPHRLAGMRRCGARGEIWRPGEVVFLADGSEARMRRMRFTGPGTVRISRGHRRWMRARRARSLLRLRPVLQLTESAEREPLRPRQVIVVAARARMQTRGRPLGARRE